MNLQYPIDKCLARDYSEKFEIDWINDIMHLPDKIENAVANLDDRQVQTADREGG